MPCCAPAAALLAPSSAGPMSASGLGGLRGRAGEGEDADPGKPLTRDVIAVVAGRDRERLKWVGNRVFPGEPCRRSLRPLRKFVLQVGRPLPGRPVVLSS